MSNCENCRVVNETKKLQEMDLIVRMEKDLQLVRGLQKILEQEIETLELMVLEQMS